MTKKQRTKLTQPQQSTAIKALYSEIDKVGTQKNFAEKVGSHQSQVSRWLDGGTVKVEKAIEIEKICGIDRSILRPDLFVIKR